MCLGSSKLLMRMLDSVRQPLASSEGEGPGEENEGLAEQNMAQIEGNCTQVLEQTENSRDTDSTVVTDSEPLPNEGHKASVTTQAATTIGQNTVPNEGPPTIMTSHSSLLRDHTLRGGNQDQLLCCTSRPATKNRRNSENMGSREFLANRLSLSQHKCRELAGEKNTLARRNDMLERRCRVLRSDLDECKTALFKLQPHDKATDDDLQRLMEKLSMNVSNWISHVFGVFDEMDDAQGIEPGKWNSASHPTCCNKSYVLNCLPKYSGISEYYLRSLIFEILSRLVFKDVSVLFGVDSEVKDLIASSKEGMKAIEAERGTNESQAGKWLTQTFNAMVRGPKYQEILAKSFKELEDAMKGFLISRFPRLYDINHSFDTLSEHVLKAAVDLANLIARTDSENYRFLVEPFIFPQLTESLSPIFTSHTEVYFVHNFKNRKVARPRDVAGFDQNRPIGNMVLMLEPSLVRMVGNGDRQITIRKGAICGALDI